MENRKFIKFLIPILLLGFFVGDIKPACAYGIDTHALLTKEAIEFYSFKTTSTTTKELTDYLIDGARKEDDIPRWMNHFFDPVYDRGLSFDAKIDPLLNLGTWSKSKDWAMNSDTQNEMKYKVPTTIASILTAIQQRNLDGITTKTDFTWNEALYFWINGEKEKSMFALGHILHLIQDMSVPDHTRNDGHPEGSIYEKWAGQFNLSNPDKNLSLKLNNKNLVYFDELGSYFNNLAKYSNNNFYSKDTIGIQSGYDLPQLNFENYQAKNGLYYMVNRDSSDKEYFLVAKKSLRNIILVNKSDMILDDDLVKHDYWSLLSPKAVQYSASIIDLFFKEAERLKDDPKFAKRESFIAQAIDLVRGVVSSIVSIVKDSAEIETENLVADIALNIEATEDNLIGEIQVGTNDELYKDNEEVGIELENNIEIEESVNEEVETSEDWIKKEDEINQPKIIIAPKPIVCAFNTNQVLNRNGLLINEVAWMGSLKSSSDEWIELKNISGRVLDISNWQILDKEEQIKIIIPENTKLDPNTFYLLERTDDSSVPNVTADILYTGALSNSNEGLRLFDNNCNLVDEVLANTEWPAGESSTKRTMERQGDFSWSTYSGSGEGSGDALILGTPKKENSIKVISYSGGSSPLVQDEPQENTQENEVLNNQPSKLLISEVQITGGTGKSNNDFVEIYNPNDVSVNLKGYRLVKRTKTGNSDTGIKSWTTDTVIQPKSFYLWANSDFTDIAAMPDVTTSGTLANDNGVAIRFGPADTGEIIDAVAWGGAENIFKGQASFSENPQANQSIQRKIQNDVFVDTDNNSLDFEIQVCPSPKTKTTNCLINENSNQAPSAFFDVSTTTVLVNEEIVFNAASSTDPDGFISLYEWIFGDGVVATSTQATTTHSYSAGGIYDVGLIIYDNENATSTASKNIVVNELDNKPSKVLNFLSEYNRNDKEINFSWNESVDSLGATSTLVYKIKDISAQPIVSEILVASTTIATTSVDVLDREYIFSIEAIDQFEISSDIATTSIFISSNTLEDLNYLMINQSNFAGGGSRSVGQVFKPVVSGMLDFIKMSLSTSQSGWAEMRAVVYEWNGVATSTIQAGRGNILATSSVKRIYGYTAHPNWSDYIWDFGGENEILLDKEKYYYLTIETQSTSLDARPYVYWKYSDGDYIDGRAFGDENNIGDFYLDVSAVRNGKISIVSPVDSYVYYDSNLNVQVKYLEPLPKKYNSITLIVSDFITGELVLSELISLTAEEQSVGWHLLSKDLNINRPGYFKISAIFNESLKSEINFSIFGSELAPEKLIDQRTLDTGGASSESFSGQVFRPLVSGKVDSLTMKVTSGDPNEVQADCYWNIYEWNGDGNSTVGSIGNLLATTSAKFLLPTTYYPGPVEETWDFDGDNEIYLDSNKYYYLSLSIVPRVSPGRPARLFISGSLNGSLIDGRLIAQGVNQGDLYLILNKKIEIPKELNVESESELELELELEPEPEQEQEQELEPQIDSESEQEADPESGLEI